MKAPVATNRWNLALAAKNTNSGPSSVASLNTGCGWALSIVCPSNPDVTILRDGAFAPPQDEDILCCFCLILRSALLRASRRMNLLDSRDRLREVARGKRREIVDAFADADEV